MPYHILLVDDDHYFRTEFREFMDDFGVIEASNGQDALKILKKPHNIDLVILDEHMPGIKGTELLAHVHKISPSTRTVILTGKSSKDVAIDAVKGHATDYIEKPLTAKKIDKIRTLLLSSAHGEKDKSTSGIKGKIEQAKYFAERNYDKKLTLNDVANEVCLSPKYLSRIFKEKTGMSFQDYKLSLRMEKAKELLKESGDNIEEISYNLGYQNPESFGKIFKQFTNFSPSEFRKKSKNKKKLSKKTKTNKKLVTLNKVVNHVKDAIIEHDYNCKVIMWSKSAEEMYGWREKDVLGKKFCDFVRDTDLDENHCPIKTLEKDDSNDSFETKRLKKSGEMIDVWIKAALIKDKNGKLKSYITTERDISNRKQEINKLLDERNTLLKQKKKLQVQAKDKELKLSKTKEQLEKERYFAGLGRLASIVAHEVRRPINSIQMAAWNIKKKNENPSLNSNITCIEEMVEESELIISNLLNYSRIKIPIYKQVIIFNLLNHCIDAAHKRFTSKKVKLIKNIHGLAKSSFPTDPVQFKQIISNIIMNAYEALPDNKTAKITIKAKTTKKHLVINISDNGIGIATDDLDKIFEPFFSKKQKGTGLGLSVCREIIALHNGIIDIDSKINKGTIVTIQFPLKQNHT